MTARTITRLVTAQPATDGAGVKINRNAGFNGELTGRENTLAYLAALGPSSDFRVVVGGEAFFLHLLDAVNTDRITPSSSSGVPLLSSPFASRVGWPSASVSR